MKNMPGSPKESLKEEEIKVILNLLKKPNLDLFISKLDLDMLRKVIKEKELSSEIRRCAATRFTQLSETEMKSLFVNEAGELLISCENEDFLNKIEEKLVEFDKFHTILLQNTKNINIIKEIVNTNKNILEEKLYDILCFSNNEFLISSLMNEKLILKLKKEQIIDILSFNKISSTFLLNFLNDILPFEENKDMLFDLMRYSKNKDISNNIFFKFFNDESMIKNFNFGQLASVFTSKTITNDFIKDFFYKELIKRELTKDQLKYLIIHMSSLSNHTIELVRLLISNPEFKRVDLISIIRFADSEDISKFTEVLIKMKSCEEFLCFLK